MEKLHLSSLPTDMPHGDMPGDQIRISEEHIEKAGIIFPKLMDLLSLRGGGRTVIAVCGGSGVGKSEAALELVKRGNVFQHLFPVQPGGSEQDFRKTSPFRAGEIVRVRFLHGLGEIPAE